MRCSYSLVVHALLRSVGYVVQLHVRMAQRVARGQKRLSRAYISKAKPPTTSMGASVMRRHENIA